MNSKQENKLMMYFSVREYVTAYSDILNALPNFQPSFTSFQGIIERLQQASEQQIMKRTSGASAKKQYRKLLIALAADTARKLKAYARFNNDQVLYYEAGVTESAFRNMADNQLRNSSQAIYDKAQELVANLAQYDVNADTQAALQQAIINFEQSISQPRIRAVESTVATSQIVSLFKAGDDVLRDMDASVEIIRLKQSDLYSGYRNVRKQVRRGRTTLALKGMVVDASDGTGLRGVKIAFVLQEEGANVSFVKKSFRQGGFYVRHAKEGIYEVTAELAGYKKAVVKAILVKGEMSALIISMEKE